MNTISTPYYRALDFTLIFILCSVAYWLRFDTFSLPLYYFLPTTVLAVTSMLSLGITNFYQNINSEFSTQQVLAAFNGLVISTMITIVCLYLTKTGEDYSRLWLITSISLISTWLLTSRIILKKIFRLSSQVRVIILLGSQRSAQMVKNNIDIWPEHGISIERQFKNFDNKAQESESYFREIVEYIESHRKDPLLKNPISEIWITYDVYIQFSTSKLSETFNNSSVSLVYIPEVPDQALNDDQQIQIIAGVPTINSTFSSSDKFGQLLKFIEDQTIAWTTLIVLSPLLLIIALSIKLGSRGPVFFRQIRYGLGGKTFSIWKFRSMESFESPAEFKQASKDDMRVTKVGKILRRTSLDELPQLFNVVNGTMSIVGPRPHPTALNEQYRTKIKDYMQRHTFKPGITGLAQVNGFRGELLENSDMDGRINYDLKYINNWSLTLDMVIILKTFTHLVTTNKAY